MLLRLSLLGLTGCFSVVGPNEVECGALTGRGIKTFPFVTLHNEPAPDLVVSGALTLDGSVDADIALDSLTIGGLPIDNTGHNWRNWSIEITRDQLRSFHRAQGQPDDVVELKLIAKNRCFPQQRSIRFRVQPDDGIPATGLRMAPQLADEQCFVAPESVVAVDLCADSVAEGAEVTLEVAGAKRGVNTALKLAVPGPASCTVGEAGATTFLTVEDAEEVRAVATAAGVTPVEVRFPIASAPMIRTVTTEAPQAGRTVVFEIQTGGDLSSCTFVHPEDGVLDGIRVGPVGSPTEHLTNGVWTAAPSTCNVELGPPWTLDGSSRDPTHRIEAVIPTATRPSTLYITCSDTLGQDATATVPIAELPVPLRPVTGLAVDIVTAEPCYARDDEELRVRVCADESSAGAQVVITGAEPQPTTVVLLPSEHGCAHQSGASVYLPGITTTPGSLAVEATGRNATPVRATVEVVAPPVLPGPITLVSEVPTRVTIGTEGWIESCEVFHTGDGELSVAYGEIGGPLSTATNDVFSFPEPECTEGLESGQGTAFLEFETVPNSPADVFWVTCTDVVGQMDTMEVHTPAPRVLTELELTTDVGPACFVAPQTSVELLACANEAAAGLQLTPSWDTAALTLASPYLGCAGAGISRQQTVTSTSTFSVTGPDGASDSTTVPVAGPPTMEDPAVVLAAGESRTILLQTDGWLSSCLLTHPGSGVLDLSMGTVGDTAVPLVDGRLDFQPPSCTDFEPGQTWMIRATNPEVGTGDVFTLTCTDGIGQADVLQITGEPGATAITTLAVSVPEAESTCFVPSSSTIEAVVCGDAPGEIQLEVSGGTVAGQASAVATLELGVSACPSFGSTVMVSTGAAGNLQIIARAGSEVDVLQVPTAGPPTIQPIGSSPLQVGDTGLYRIESGGLAYCSFFSPILHTLTLRSGRSGEPLEPITDGLWTLEPPNTCDEAEDGPWLLEIETGSEPGDLQILCGDRSDQTEVHDVEVLP